MSISAANGSRPGNESFSLWLKEGPVLSLGARNFLAARRRIHRQRFIPITLFGFALDESGGSNEWPPARVEPGADAPGDAI